MQRTTEIADNIEFITRTLNETIDLIAEMPADARSRMSAGLCAILDTAQQTLGGKRAETASKAVGIIIEHRGRILCVTRGHHWMIPTRYFTSGDHRSSCGGDHRSSCGGDHRSSCGGDHRSSCGGDVYDHATTVADLDLGLIIEPNSADVIVKPWGSYVVYQLDPNDDAPLVDLSESDRWKKHQWIALGDPENMTLYGGRTRKLVRTLRFDDAGTIVESC